jgi:hypothetical protein
MAMAEDTLTMHQTFISELRQRRHAITEELKRIDTVEQYHNDVIAQLSNPAPQVAEEVVDPPIERTHTDLSLKGLTKHGACELALRQLGGRQKTTQVADWLLSRGYGSNMKKRVFCNACYTAMNRKKEVFKKMNRGEWEVIEKPSNPHGAG